jgi:hypothetical protein
MKNLPGILSKLPKAKPSGGEWYGQRKKTTMDYSSFCVGKCNSLCIR